MEIIDTIDDMISLDYKKRFKAEYHQTEIRCKKLHRLLEAEKHNNLPFELNCPIELLQEQYFVMCRYLSLLTQRAIIENIQLN